MCDLDTGASVTIARPDMVTGLPERKPSRAYVLQTASGETIPVKEALVELTLGRQAKYLGVRRRNHGRVHPGAGYPAGPRRVHGHKKSSVAAGPGGRDAMETGYPNQIR